MDISEMKFIKNQGQIQANSVAPEIAIISPANNSNYTISKPIEVKVNAFGSYGSISKVEFFIADEKMGEDFTMPYSFIWNPAKIGSYTLTATATDNKGTTSISNKVGVTITKSEQLQSCSGTGSLTWQYWINVPYGNISSIPLNRKPDGEKILNSFSTPVNFSNYYGARSRGYICPPQTGQYIFYVGGDDMGELWLSTDANPDNKQRIAYFDEWASPGDYTKNASQRSKSIFLQAGQKYYVEALHLEGSGGDHLSVAWTMPNGVMESPIPGSRLSPFETNVVVATNNCEGAGAISWDYWLNVYGGSISQVPLNKPADGGINLPSFSSPINFGNNYGSRARGMFVCLKQVIISSLFLQTMMANFG